MTGKLTSWKEIASYLDVSVRTAQLWERERGLPVHRAPGGVRGQVFALVEELDAWHRPEALLEAPENPRRWGWGAGALAVALTLSAAGFLIWFLLPSADGRPRTLAADRDGFTVFDESGARLWRWAAPHALDVRQYAPECIRHLHFFADIDGDGAVEVVFAASYAQGGTFTSEVICLTASGKVAWRFSCGRAVRTRREEFPPVFMVEDLHLVRGRRARPLIVAASRQVDAYPAQIAILDGKGALQREYWHSGGFLSIEPADLDHDGQDELYAGGTNNARKRATLIVLDPEILEGASDESTNPDYQLLDHPPGKEVLRLLFPDSEVSRAAGFRPYVTGLDIQGDNVAMKILHGVSANASADVLYRLGPDGKVIWANLSDGYAQLQAQYAAGGWIRRKPDAASELARLRAVETLRPVAE